MGPAAKKVSASSQKGSWNSSSPANFSTYVASPPLQLFAVSDSYDPFTIINTNIRGACPVAVNTINREVYWYSTTKQLLRGHFDSNSVESLVSPKVAPLMSNLTVLALAYDWVGERLYFAAKAGRSFSLWRIPLINPDGLENVFNGPSINDSRGVKLVMDPFSGYVYWTMQEGGNVVLYQQDLRAINKSIPTRRLDQSITKIQLQSMTLDPSNGYLWVSDAATGNILSCDAKVWNCSIKVNATAFLNGLDGRNVGVPATSIALDENHIYWSRQGTPGIFYANISGPVTPQVLSYGNVSAVFSTSPGQQPLPIPSCLSYDLSTRSVPYQLSATTNSILIGWNEPPLSAACQSITFSFPTLTYVVNVVQYMTVKLPQYPQPGVLTVATTLTLDRNLSAFMPYDVQVSAYNRYTVPRFASGFNATTGVVIDYSRMVTVMTLVGEPAEPQNLAAKGIGTQAIFVSWDPVNMTGNTSLYYIHLRGKQAVSSSNSNYTLRGLNPGRTYEILVVAANELFNSTPAVVNASTWPLPPAPVLLNQTNTSAVVMVNVTSIGGIIKSYTVKVSNELLSNDSTTDQIKVFVLNDLRAYTEYSINTVATYSSDEIQESLPLVIKTGSGIPDAPFVSISTILNILLWRNVHSNDERGIIGYRLLIDSTAEGPRSKFISTSDVISQGEEENVYDLELLQLCVKGNETETYYLTLFAQNSIGEGTGSNSIVYICTKQKAATYIIGVVAAGLAAGLAAVVIYCIAALSAVLCVTYVKQKTKQSPARDEVDWDTQASHSSGKIALNPQYSWSRGDYTCTDEELQNIEYFPKEKLEFGSLIGKGEFGEVYQGTATDILGVNTGNMFVAIKILRKEASQEEQKKFLSEAALMRNFNNPHIVKILGVCTDSERTCTIMELMSGGDLLHYLRDAKPEDGPVLLTLKELMRAAVDVVKGCCYLEQARFIHRDIAARNCLVSSKGADRVVKVGDFGLARDLYSSDYYQVEGKRRLPVRWMAPEALLQGRFTLESDVWSYGVLLWEIMTLGNQPYPGLTNQEVLHFVTGGGRLDKPERCPKEIYQLMQKCWSKSLSERPHFDDILKDLDTLLANHLNMYESSEDGRSMEREHLSHPNTGIETCMDGGMQVTRSSCASSQSEHGSVGSLDLPESYHV